MEYARGSCQVVEPATRLPEYKQHGSELGSRPAHPALISQGIVQNHSGVKRKGPQRPPGPSSALDQVKYYYFTGQKREQGPRGVKFLDKVTHSQVAEESLAPGTATRSSPSPNCPREDVPFTCTVSS